MHIDKINELIETEKAYAITVNPQMALGMSQIQQVLNDHYKANKEECDGVLVTPAGNFKAVLADEIDFPKIDVIEVDKNGEDIGLVSSVEYNKLFGTLSTYAYEEQFESSHEVEHVNKTIYRTKEA